MADEITKLADTIIAELDCIAREYDSYEYGLPLHLDMDGGLMQRTVVEILRSRISALEAGREADGERIRQARELLAEAKKNLIDSARVFEVDEHEQCACLNCRISRLLESLAATVQKGKQHD